MLATVWALAPALISALAIGAWPLLLVHALLPLLALAVGRAIGLPHKVSQASVSGAAAGGSAAARARRRGSGARAAGALSRWC